MNKRILSSLICTFLISQSVNTNVCAMSTGIELTTAAFRAPILIMAKKAEQDKNFKKAYLLGAMANFIRLTNDLSALYNLYQKNNDENLYKLTKVMWVGQDFLSLLVKIKSMTSTDSSKWKKIEADGEKKLNLILSDFLKKLDLYILPAIEGAASVLLCWDSTQDDSTTNSLSLLLQIVVSGSRLLADMIETESGSMDQKIIITTSLVHAVLLIADLVKTAPANAKPKKAAVAEPVKNAVLSDHVQESESTAEHGDVAHIEPVEVLEPTQEAAVEDEPMQADDDRMEIEPDQHSTGLKLIDVPGGELGLIRTEKGIRSARVALMRRQDYTQFFGRGAAQKKILKKLDDAMRSDY